jgi:hypothetical protein
MNLDHAVRQACPHPRGPSPAVVDRHRRVLTSMIRSVPTDDLPVIDHRARAVVVERRPRVVELREPDGHEARPRRRSRLVVAAVVAVLVAVPAAWYATNGPDRSTPIPAPPADGTAPITIPEAPSTTETSNPSVATTNPTVIPEPGCGDSLPVAVEVLDGGVEPVMTVLASEIPGQVAQRITAGDVVVEVRWPAPVRETYDSDNVAEPFPDDIGTGSAEGSNTHEVQLARLGTNNPFLRITNVPDLVVDDNCRIVEFTVSSSSSDPARFGWDVTAPGGTFPAVDLGALVLRSQHVDVAPSEAVECFTGDDQEPPPNEHGGAETDTHPTPAAALAALVTTPAAERWFETGYLEMITPDNRYVYARPAPTVGGTDETRFVAIVTVEERPGEPGAWFVSGWTMSGC